MGRSEKWKSSRPTQELHLLWCCSFTISQIKINWPCLLKFHWTTDGSILKIKRASVSYFWSLYLVAVCLAFDFCFWKAGIMLGAERHRSHNLSVNDLFLKCLDKGMTSAAGWGQRKTWGQGGVLAVQPCLTEETVCIRKEGRTFHSGRRAEQRQDGQNDRTRSRKQLVWTRDQSRARADIANLGILCKCCMYVFFEK